MPQRYSLHSGGAKASSTVEKGALAIDPFLTGQAIKEMSFALESVCNAYGMIMSSEICRAFEFAPVARCETGRK